MDGFTGERNIFKRRGEDPNAGGQQKKPKRLRFVIDVSKSMGRMNGEDRRLDRTAATVLMLMQSLDGFAHKYDYSIVGHDGDSPLIPLVDWGRVPSSPAQKQRVLEMMYFNVGNCGTGDNTLTACEMAVQEVTKQEADDYFVFLLSDANLREYGVSASVLARTLTADKKVKSYAIFIADKESSEDLMSALPIGHGFAVNNTKMLPKIFKDIFTSSLISKL